MPPLPLTSVLHDALPQLSRVSRAVVSTLACRNGAALPADEMAVSVGLGGRHQLARQLRRDGLPPLERLAGWTRVVHWILEAKATDTSLLQLARREHLDPAAAYRLVHRVTGQCWSAAQRAGLSVALGGLRKQCRPPAVRPPRRTVAQRAPAARPPLARRLMALGPLRAPAPGHPRAVLEQRLRLAGHPFDVAVTPAGLAYVTCVRAAAVACLELSPLRVVGFLPTGAAPTRVVVSPSGDEAYVTNQFTEDVTILDLVEGRRSATVAVSGHPGGAALSPDARTLYVTTNADRLCAISIAGRRVVGSIPVPLVCSGLGVHPSGRLVYVSTWRAGLILEVDARTLLERRRFAVGGAPQDLAVTRDGMTLYSANHGGWLDAIHLPSGRAARCELGTAAFSVALSPDHAVLYVGLRAAGRVVQVDPRTLRVLGGLDAGGTPGLITFEPSGRVALVPNDAGWVDLVGRYESSARRPA